MRKNFFIQIVFWIVLAGINLGFASNILTFPNSLLPVFISLFFLMGAFYGNIFILFPRFFKNKNNSKFYLISILTVLIVGLIYSYTDYLFMSLIKIDLPHKFHFPIVAIVIRSFFWLFLMQMISTIYMMQQHLKKQAEETILIKEEKLSTELKYLKAQINPHFLFNALNNIYSLSYLKSDKAPEGIIKLSNMLRYVLDDCQADHVRLGSEIEYIESFIQFQVMKTSDPQNIIFDYFETDLNVEVAPMLFIPLIENSFKYSKVESVEEAFVRIRMKTETNILYFEIDNSIPSTNRAISGSGKGIGNVKHRLNILYPQRHKLEIAESENEFAVTLTIKV